MAPKVSANFSDFPMPVEWKGRKLKLLADYGVATQTFITASHSSFTMRDNKYNKLSYSTVCVCVCVYNFYNEKAGATFAAGQRWWRLALTWLSFSTPRDPASDLSCRCFLFGLSPSDPTHFWLPVSTMKLSTDVCKSHRQSVVNDLTRNGLSLSLSSHLIINRCWFSDAGVSSWPVQ